MKAICVHTPGGPDVLELEESPIPEPAEGEAIVKAGAIGVNYIDVYHRTGLYKMPLPFTPGMEAAGTVVAVGSRVSEVRPGDRVAYAMSPGAYAEYARVAAWRLAQLPDALDFRAGAAVMLQGMTAHYLTHSVFALKAGDRALVHAAAGGVGLLLIQIAKKRGATVYGTVSTAEKAALARDAGADGVILYTNQDFEAEVRRLTDDKGVDVVYDSVGQSTFDKSLNCLRPRGMLALFGQSSGKVPPFETGLLGAKGSLFLTRPALANYCADRAEMLWRTGDLFGWLASGELKLRIDRTFPLALAADAHRELEGRRTSGKVLLIP